PMLHSGDEVGHSKMGNNNTYCQDNELSWINWDLDRDRRRLLDFTRFIIKLRNDNPVLRRRSFFRGRTLRDPHIRDVRWFRPDGEDMRDEDCVNPHTRCFGMLLAGDAIEEIDERGNHIEGDTLLVIFNAYFESISFTLPQFRLEGQWQLVLDTRHARGKCRCAPMNPGDSFDVDGRSLSLFRFDCYDQETD
ncbi:MAG: hypothetical protein AAGU11_18400, partial [Syntrophobacteraceae bacterium]